MSLKDKIVLITGAGRGLGRGIARAFANAGAKIAVNERQEKDSADTVQMIKSAGGDAMEWARTFHLVKMSSACSRRWLRTTARLMSL
jgi:NAD(P)-dependent dehydrogenase (short-subunit alcohol dehydrogenase family)